MMKDKIKDLMDEICAFTQINNEYKISEVNHEKLEKLKNNEMGIYIFYDDKNVILKVGKVNSYSNERWIYQHYNMYSSKSNLALSIFHNHDYCQKHDILCDENNIKEWIKNNTKRINIVIQRAGHSDAFKLNLIESWLHLKLNPLFEGRALKKI